MLDGRPTLRHPDGEDELAHIVRNDTDSTVVTFSKTSKVASVYPDSGKIAIWTGNDADDLIVKRTSVGYWDAES